MSRVCEICGKGPGDRPPGELHQGREGPEGIKRLPHSIGQAWAGHRGLTFPPRWRINGKVRPSSPILPGLDLGLDDHQRPKAAQCNGPTFGPA
jgi:hypothetical protein